MLTCQEVIDKRCDLWYEHENAEKDREYVEAVADKITEDSDQGQALRKEIEADPSLLIEMVFVIVNKEQKTVPFFLNKIQQDFIDELNQAIKDYKAGRINFIRFLNLFLSFSVFIFFLKM